MSADGNKSMKNYLASKEIKDYSAHDKYIEFSTIVMKNIDFSSYEYPFIGLDKQNF